MPFLVGLVVGVLMCIPVGPINIWVVNTQLKRGAAEAMSIALGGSLMDFFYFVTLSSGISLLPLEDSTTLGLKAFGVCLLLVFGLKELFWSRPMSLDGQTDARTIKPPVGAGALGRYFLFGILIYASNPTLVATLTALTASIRSFGLFEANFNNHIWLAVGAGLGSAIWFAFLIWLVRRYRHLIQGKLMLWAERGCAILVVIFALIMGIKLVQEIRAYKKVALIQSKVNLYRN